MKFSTLFILACVGAILFAAFAGSGSSSPSATTGPAASRPESRPLAGGAETRPSYANPLDPAPARPPVYSPQSFGGAGNTANASTDTATVASSPSFFSTALNFLRKQFGSSESRRTAWTVEDLRIARGQVATIEEGRVFIDCQAWNVVQAGDWRIHAGDGFSKSPILGIGDSADEMARFGPLKALVRGSFVPSPYNPRLWSPDRYLNGQIAVEGLPASAGQNIKIVVALVGMMKWENRDVPIYTAAFQLDSAETAPGAWMWQGSGQGPLDKIPTQQR
jgi:hypothetical protein